MPRKLFEQGQRVRFEGKPERSGFVIGPVKTENETAVVQLDREFYHPDRGDGMVEVPANQLRKIPTPKPKRRNPAAVALGALGGRARARSLTPKKRRAIAALGAQARWAKKTN